MLQILGWKRVGEPHSARVKGVCGAGLELSLSRRSAIEESNQGLRNSLCSSTGTVYPPTRQGIRGPGLPV